MHRTDNRLGGAHLSRRQWIIAGAMLAVTSLGACGTSDSSVATNSTPKATGEVVAPEAPRLQPAVAVGGEGVAVVGGESYESVRTDGYLLTESSAKPLPPLPRPLYRPSAVWGGDRVIVVGIACDELGPNSDEAKECRPGGMEAYELNGAGWRALSRPPIQAGRELAVDAVGFVAGLWVFTDGRTVFSYDSRSDRWSTSSSDIESPSLICADDSRIGFVSDRGHVSVDGRDVATDLSVQTLDPSTDRRSDVRTVGGFAPSSQFFSVNCVGMALLVLTGRSGQEEAAVLVDFEGEQRAVAGPPVQLGPSVTIGSSTAGAVFLAPDGSSIVFDVASDSWTSPTGRETFHQIAVRLQGRWYAVVSSETGDPKLEPLG